MLLNKSLYGPCEAKNAVEQAQNVRMLILHLGFCSAFIHYVVSNDVVSRQ